MLPRYVDGDVHRRTQVLQEQAHLDTRAAAQLDETGAVTDQFGDLLRVAVEDRYFGARKIILRQFADTFEELRADMIVKEFGRQNLGRGGESCQHFLYQTGGTGMKIMKTDGRHYPLSSAKRIPLNCQRSAG